MMQYIELPDGKRVLVEGQQAQLLRLLLRGDPAGMTTRDIAKEIGCSVQGVPKVVYRLRAKLNRFAYGWTIVYFGTYGYAIRDQDQ